LFFFILSTMEKHPFFAGLYYWYEYF